MHRRDGDLSVYIDLARCDLFLGANNERHVHQHHQDDDVMRKLLKDTRGAAMVEYALVALPVILFMFGIMQTAWIVWADNLLQVSVDAGHAAAQSNRRPHHAW